MNLINNKGNELIKNDELINNKGNELIKNDELINNKENELIENDDMINNKENKFIENDDMINNKENEFIENDNKLNNKENEFIENDGHFYNNNKENKYSENDEQNNNKENENKYDNFEHNQNIDINNNKNMNNDENISITNNMAINKIQNRNNLRTKLFKNNENQKIEINKKKKKILNKDGNEFENNNDDMMNKNEKIKIDFDEEQNKDIFFNDKIENEEAQNNIGNGEDRSFKENLIIRIESKPIIENDSRQKIKKPKIHLRVEESNILNQITSTVFIKEEDNNKNESQKENKNENENENIDEKKEFINNKENINDDNNDVNDNDYNDNKLITFKENISKDKFDQSNNSLEEIDLIANHPINNNINESENSFMEIDIIGNNKIDKNEIKNTDLTNPNLLKRKNQINEKDLKDDKNEKILLKRQKQINENNMEIYDSEIFNENIPNRINISKVTKLQEHPYLTLYELMDELSNKKIDLNFYEIKDIVFIKEDLNQNFDKNIKKLIRNGIPKTFISAEKPKIKSIYTPQKIKMGKKTFMIKKLNMNNNNKEENERGTFEFKNYNTENIELKKKITRLVDSNKKNITSLKFTNLNNKMNKKIVYGQNDDDNLLYKNFTDTNIKNIVKNRYDENDMTDNDQNEVSEAKKSKQNSNFYVNLKSVPNLNSTTNKRTISPLFKKKINISKGMKLNNFGGNKIKKDN